MNLLTFGILIMALVSCGKDGGKSASKDLVQESESLTLNEEESLLSRKLISMGQSSQKELLKILVATPGINTRSFKKLDHVMNINCIETSGLCYYSPKE